MGQPHIYLLRRKYLVCAACGATFLSAVSAAMAVRNAAVELLLNLLQDVRRALPTSITLVAAGTTDICHRRWDSGVSERPASEVGLAYALAEPYSQTQTLLFWMDELLSDHGMPATWDHSLDGGCLWSQMCEGGENFLCNVLYGLSISVASWLRFLAKSSVTSARVVCLCRTGQHHSVFLSRMLCCVLQAVYDLLGLQYRHFSWEWACYGRLLKKEHGESAEVQARVKKLFLSQSMPKPLCSLAVLDASFLRVGKTDSADYRQYSLDARKYLTACMKESALPLLREWFENRLPHWTETLLPLAGCIDVRTSWLPFVQQIRTIFPARCYLCSEFNMMNGWRSIAASCCEFVTHADGAPFLATTSATASDSAAAEPEDEVANIG